MSNIPSATLKGDGGNNSIYISKVVFKDTKDEFPAVGNSKYLYIARLEGAIYCWQNKYRMISGVGSGDNSSLGINDDIVSGQFAWSGKKIKAELVDTAEQINLVIGDLSELSTNNKDSIVDAINELKSTTDSNFNDLSVTIEEITSTEMYKSYLVKQGKTKIGQVDIPKDNVIISGSIVTNPTNQPDGMYLRFIFANQDTPMYINVDNLIDKYTGKPNSNQIQMVVDETTKEISAQIIKNSITNTELAPKSVSLNNLTDDAKQAFDAKNSAAQALIDSKKYIDNESAKLSGQLLNIEVELENKANSNSVDRLQEQINNIVLSPSEGGNENAEIAQARVGRDGHNFATLKERLDYEQLHMFDNINILWTDGSLVNGANGVSASESGFSESNYIDISAYRKYPIEICCRYGSTGGYALYDSNYTYIMGGNKNTDGVSVGNHTETIVVPDNATYIRITAMTNNKALYYVKPILTVNDIVNITSKSNMQLLETLNNATNEIKKQAQEYGAYNLLPELNITENVKSGIAMSAENGTYTISGTSSAVWFYNIAGSETSYPANFIEGETYHIIFEPSTNKVYLRIYQFDDENPSGKSILLTNKSTTFTVPAGANGLIVRLHIGASNTVATTTVTPCISKNPTNAQFGATTENILDSISKIKTAIKDYGAINLIPELTIAENTKSGITMSADSGTYTVSGTASAVWFYNIAGSTTSYPVDFVEGETYRIIFEPTDKWIYLRIIQFTDKNPSGVDVVLTNQSTTFTVPTGANGLIVRLHVGNTNTANGTVKPFISKNLTNAQLEELMVGEAPPAMLTIIDDDGHIGFVNDLMPIIESRHIPIASAITQMRIGTKSKWMSWEQILDCYSRGAEILCHTYDHDPDTPNKDIKQIEWEYTVARNEMFKRGLHNADILVYNNVTGKSEKCQEAASKVFKCAIHSSGRVINHVGAINPYYIQRIPVELDPYYYDVEQLKTLIDQNIEQGGWMIWIIHTSEDAWEEHNGADAITACVDYAIEKGLPIVSADYGYRKYIARE